jgi:hypothetical protein
MTDWFSQEALEGARRAGNSPNPGGDELGAIVPPHAGEPEALALGERGLSAD